MNVEIIEAKVEDTQLLWSWVQDWHKKMGIDVHLKSMNQQNELFGMDRLSNVLRDEQGEVIGFYTLIFQKDGVVEISKLYVDMQCMGQGLGTLLLDHAIGLAKQHKASFMVLNTSSKFKEAVKLYQKSGFNIHSTCNGSFCDLRMEKVLND